LLGELDYRESCITGGQHTEERGQTSMPWAGLKPMILVL